MQVYNECMGKFNYAKTDTAIPKLKYGCDNTTALGLIATLPFLMARLNI